MMGLPLVTNSLIFHTFRFSKWIKSISLIVARFVLLISQLCCILMKTSMTVWDGGDWVAKTTVVVGGVIVKLWIFSWITSTFQGGLCVGVDYLSRILMTDVRCHVMLCWMSVKPWIVSRVLRCIRRRMQLRDCIRLSH